MRNIHWINMFIFGSAVLSILLGLTFMWFGGQSSELSCTRRGTTQVDCQLQRQFLGAIPAGRQLITKMSGTEVKEDCGEGCTYWLELLADEGNVRLTRFSSYNRRGVLADQQQIDESLNNTALKSFEYTSRPSWLLFLVGIPLIGLGGFLVNGFRKNLFSS